MEEVAKLFGRTYSEVGNSNSDFIIKTRGQVKIQYGKKFIDIIKDGKLNVNVDIFKKVDSSSNIKENGIYYCNDDESIYIQIEEQTIQIRDGADSTYVSYINKQETSPEQKQQAQTNIGLVFNTLGEAQDQIISGFVYILEDQSFYTVTDSNFSKLEFDIPNPYLKQLSIKRNDSESGGALKLIGDNKQNGLTINSYTNIYENGGDTIIENEYGNIIIIQNNKSVFTIDNKGITSLVDVITKESFIGNNIHSTDFLEGNTGYRLYYNNSTGKSILEVDQIIERDAQNMNNIIRTYSEGSIAINTELVMQDGEDIIFSGISFTSSPELQTLKVGDILEIQPYLNFTRTYTEEDEDGNTIEEELEYLQKVAILIQVETINNAQISCKFLSQITQLEEQYKVNTVDYGEVIVSGNLNEQFKGSTFYRIATIGDKEDSSTWLETFCTDYINNSISLQQNYVNEDGELIIYKHSIIGDIISENVLDEPHRIWNQGLYSDQSVFSGTVFRFPLQMSNSDSGDIQNFPRYSAELNEELITNHTDIPDEDEFEKVIPTIGWIKNNSSLKEPLKSINNSDLGDPPTLLATDIGSYPVGIVFDDTWKYENMVPYSVFESVIQELSNKIQNLQDIVDAL